MKGSSWNDMVKGDRVAFLAIYQLHYQALFSYGFSLSSDRELTKDCIQELFLEIWKNRFTLNKEVDNVRSYLFTWLRRKINKEFERLKKEKINDQITEDFEVTQASYEELLVTFQQSEEKKEELRRALKKLTKKQLEIIKLKFFENLSCSAIASKTSLTPRTVYNLMYEAMRQLREAMRLMTVYILL